MMNAFAILRPPALAFCAALLAAAPAAAATVEVTVTNIKKARGHVHVELCPEAKWLQDCLLVGEARADKSEVIVRVLNVPPGVYAAQIYQDENDNERVDRGPFGIPREPIGFSNDAPLHKHGPLFEDARFHVGSALTRITIRLRHLL